MRSITLRTVSAVVSSLIAAACGQKAWASGPLDPAAYSSLGSLSVGSGEALTINTTTGTLTVTSGGTPVASYTTSDSVTQSQTAQAITVFDFSSINIASGVTITLDGASPLALLSRSNAAILSPLTASGGSGVQQEFGTGVTQSPAAGAGVLGGGSGGAGATTVNTTASAGTSTLSSVANGATAYPNPNSSVGGEDGAGGGNGGAGGSGNSGAQGGSANPYNPASVLVGGGGGSGGAYATDVCGSGSNCSSNPTGAWPSDQDGSGGGAGGGAIEIVAAGSLTVDSLSVNGGSGGGALNSIGGNGLQLGGGGAGGDILLSGASLTVAGSLSADGGSPTQGTGGAGGGGQVYLAGAPSWVLGTSTLVANDTSVGGVTVSAGPGVIGGQGYGGQIYLQTQGVTAPAGETATFDGQFTNSITTQTSSNQGASLVSLTMGPNLILDGGALQFTTNATFAAGNGFVLTANGGTVDTQGYTGTVAAPITGSGELQKTGSGTLVLSSSGTYAGETLISAGTLALSGSGSIASSAQLIDSGIFDISGTAAGATITSLAGGGTVNLGARTLSISDNTLSTSFSGTIAGTGAVDLLGGTQLLLGTGTYSGGTSIGAGATLVINGASAIGTGPLGLNGNAAAATLTIGGSTTLAEAVTVSGESVFDVLAGTTRITGAITDGGSSGQLFVTGGGTLALSSTNTYSGGTRVLDGSTLAIDSGTALGTGALDLVGSSAPVTLMVNGSTSISNPIGLAGDPVFDIAPGTTTTVTGVIADAGSPGDVSVAGGGTLALAATNTYSGGTIVQAGSALAIQSGAALGTGGLSLEGSSSTAATLDVTGTTGITNAISISGQAILDPAAGSIVTVSAIGDGSAPGSLTVSGPGTVQIIGPATYTGTTDIQAGALALSGNGAIPASAGVTDDGILDISGTNSGAALASLAGTGAVALGTRTLTLSAAQGSFSGAIGGAGGLTVTGGAETLLGANQYTGTTTLRGGTLALSGDGSIASSAGLVDDGTFDISGTATGASIRTLSGTGTVELGSQTLTLTGAQDTFSGAIGGSGALVLASGTETLSGSNSFSGGVTVDAGATLAVGNASVLGAGLLRLQGGSGSSATLAVTSTTTLANPVTVAGDPTFDIASGTTTTVSSAIADGASPGDLVKIGGGTLDLLATNTYSGQTTVDGGVLQVEGSISSPVTVASGAALQGHGVINGDVANSGTVFPGGSIGVLTITGNYTQSAAGLLNLEITPSTTAGVGYDQLLVSGSAHLAGSLGVLVDPGSYTLGTKYDVVHANGGISGTFSQVGYGGPLGNYIQPVVAYQKSDVYLELDPLPLAYSSGRVSVASAFIEDQSLFSVLEARLEGGDLAALAEGSAERGVWVRGLGSFGSANGFDIGSEGTMVGGGAEIGRGVTFGGALSYLTTTTSDSTSRADGEYLGGYGYGIYTDGGLRTSFVAGIGHLSGEYSRAIPALHFSASSSNSGTYEVAGMRVAYELDWRRWSVTPYGAAEYLHTGSGGMNEGTASILALNYGGVRSSVSRLSTGITVGLALPERAMTVLPWIDLGGLATAGPTHVSQLESLGGMSQLESATVSPRAALSPALGIDLIGNASWRANLDWQGAYGSGTSQENFAATVRFVW